MTTSDLISLFSMIGTCVSAIASVVTLIFAKKALNAWRSQEVLKIKKDFKISLLDMRAVVLWLPVELNPEQVMYGRQFLYEVGASEKSTLPKEHVAKFEGLAREYEKFEDAMMNCSRNWSVTESLFKNTEIELLWRNVYLAYNEYTQGRQDQSYFMSKLTELINVELYFDSPIT